jgi:hypothetical protein
MENKQTQDNKDELKKYKTYGWIAAKAVLAIWLLYWIFIRIYLDQYPERGQFGDMFGAINALFTGLAFAGLIVTIIMQSKELKFQGEQLEFQGQQLKLQNDEIKIQNEALISSTNEFKVQNSTMKVQQFENLFFNAVSIHKQHVSNSRKTNQSQSGTRQQYSGRELFDLVRIEIARFIGDTPYVESEYIKFRTKYYHAYNVYAYFLGPYINSVLMVLQVIDGSKLIDDETKHFYIGLFLSTLSDFERLFLFYHIPLSDKKNNNTNYRLYQLYKNYVISIYLNNPWMHRTHSALQNYDIDLNPSAHHYITS